MQIADEIDLKILDFVQVGDLLNFSVTSIYYHNLCKDNHLWKSKYLQKFLLVNQKKLHDINWKKIYKEEYQPQINQIKHCFYPYNFPITQVIGNLYPSIEEVLIDLTVKKIRQLLLDHKNIKIIIICKLVKTAQLFVQLLSDCKLLFLKSLCSSTCNDIDNFNSSNMQLQILISTLSIVSQGLDLGDKLGNYYRYMFVLLDNYRPCMVIQLAGRVMRFENKSPAVVELIDSETNQNKYQYDNLAYNQGLRSFKYLGSHDPLQTRFKLAETDAKD